VKSGHTMQDCTHEVWDREGKLSDAAICRYCGHRLCGIELRERFIAWERQTADQSASREGKQ